MLYIYDTIELFSTALEPLHKVWVDELRPAMHAITAKRAEGVAKVIFASVTDDTREAALIPQDRRLTAEDIRAVCSLGLEQILA